MSADSEKSFYLGVDSDGCAIDSMEFKHRHCFAPATIETWGLQGCAEAALEVALFVNLYSPSRGKNRFPALLETLDLLKTHPAVRESVPELLSCDDEAFRNWLSAEPQPSAPKLEKAARADGGPSLHRVLEWNRKVNENVRTKAKNLTAFHGVSEALEGAARQSVVHIVSSADAESVRREWSANGLMRFVTEVSAQESGTKEDALKQAEVSGFGPGERMLVGDSPGDRTAARRTGSLFYPILPGGEAASWHRFTEEALPRWFSHSFDDDYQNELLRDFDRALPDRPPWDAARTPASRSA